MPSFDCNEKLKVYLDDIKTKTNRKVRIIEIPKEKMYNMKSAFIHHPKIIQILIVAGSNPKDTEIEQSIAHEATHGLLAYRMRYCIGFFKRKPDEKEKKTVTLLFTMVTDIVVNNLLQQAGFLPYSPKYPEMVDREIQKMDKDLKLYDDLLGDLDYRDKHLVFRYILAWGYLTYFELQPGMLDKLMIFTEKFRIHYPSQYANVQEVQRVVRKNDIFTESGYRAAIEELLTLWNLNELVELKSVDS